MRIKVEFSQTEISEILREYVTRRGMRVAAADGIGVRFNVDPGDQHHERAVSATVDAETEDPNQR